MMIDFLHANADTCTPLYNLMEGFTNEDGSKRRRREEYGGMCSDAAELEAHGVVMEYVHEHVDARLNMQLIGKDFVGATTEEILPMFKELGFPGSCIVNGKACVISGKHGDVTLRSYEGSPTQQQVALLFNNCDVAIYNAPVTFSSTSDSSELLAVKRNRGDVKDLQCLQGFFDVMVVERVIGWFTIPSQESLVKLYCSIARNVRYSGGCFYVYHRHAWVKDVESYLTITDIMKIITDILSEVKVILNSTGRTNFDQTIQESICRIQSFSYTLAISKLCKSFVEDNSFVDKLDSDWTIIPFTNGVYDIKTKEFRDHRMEDYISKTVSYAYSATVTSDALDKFLGDIMPSREQLQYLLHTCATFLNGLVPNDMLVFIVGTGGNGKSMFMDLLNLTLGDLCSTVSSTLFTRDDTGSNVPRPDLIRLRTRRFGYITEPDTGTLNNAIVKKLCGSDWISCRNLYQQQTSFKFRTKFAIVCNDLPEVSSGDDAIWRRIRVIKFSTKFVTTPATLLEKKLDPTLSDTITNTVAWRQALMNKLLSLLNIVVDTPTEFTVIRQAYMDSSNDFTNFLSRHVRRSPDSILQFSSVLKLYYEKEEDIPKTRTREYMKLFKLMEKYVDETFTDHQDVKYGQFHKQGNKGMRGWYGLGLSIQ